MSVQEAVLLAGASFVTIFSLLAGATILREWARARTVDRRRRERKHGDDMFELSMHRLGHHDYDGNHYRGTGWNKVRYKDPEELRREKTDTDGCAEK